jgi:hypothetical protein
MKDLKALSKLAVDRALAARAAAGVELSAEQVEAVSGGAGGLAYIKDPSWYGIWEKLKAVDVVNQPVLTSQVAVDLGPNAKLEAGIAAGKLAF